MPSMLNFSLNPSNLPFSNLPLYLSLAFFELEHLYLRAKIHQPLLLYVISDIPDLVLAHLFKERLQERNERRRLRIEALPNNRVANQIYVDTRIAILNAKKALNLGYAFSAPLTKARACRQLTG
jgi:hypothetical protein